MLLYSWSRERRDESFRKRVNRRVKGRGGERRGREKWKKRGKKKGQSISFAARAARITQKNRIDIFPIGRVFSQRGLDTS